MAGILDRFKEEIAEKTEIDLSKKIKVGIIGTGWIAEAHVNAYKKCPDVEIIAAADLIPGKAEAFCKANGLENIKFYPSHKELIDEAGVDAVSVCTYNATHAECTIYALDHGVSVLLEKPMCVTLDEAVEICRAEKRNNAVLSIGFQPRFDENMKMLKKICQSGELGKIYYIQTGGGRRRGIPTPYGTSFIEKETAGIGALGDIGCYSLDMVLNSIGYPKPLTVSGYKSAYFGKDPSYEHHDVFGVDDFAAGFIRLEGDIILDFRIAWAMNLDTPGDTIIMGTKGSVRVPSTECWNGSIGGPLVIYHEIAGNQVETIVEEKHNDTDCFDIKIRSFVEAVKNGGEAPVPCSQILYNQAIIDGFSRSAELGREIAIEIPEI